MHLDVFDQPGKNYFFNNLLTRSYVSWCLLRTHNLILVAGADALSKKAAAKQSVYLISLSRWVFALPVLALMTFQSRGAARPGMGSVPLYLILMPLEILAMILYIKAIARYDLSMTVPLLLLTPLFLLVTVWLFLARP